MRKTIRAVTALTFGLLMASSGFAAQTVVVNHDCHGCGNFSGNVVNSNNHVHVNVDIVSHSFNGNQILSHNNVSTSVVSGSGNSFSGSLTIP
jgi:hypothetical protein